MPSQRGTASNHYDLLARLAGGGMAEIFLARALGLEGFERYVVLKRIRPERTDDPKFVAMFLDEARLAAQLQHPNIAQVFDLGRIGDDYFYTMEFVHGRDVLDILERQDEVGSRAPLAVVLAIISSAAAGLAHAHERRGADGKSLGIVHRDISPSNLMVSYEGTVKVLDFGIAKARVRSTETQAGMIMGKVAYLSPEQCRTSNIDHRSDIFSLGIVFYELVTGERAFKRDADFETLRAIIGDEPPLPSSIVPALPKSVDEIIMRCLAKDPDDRYATATELIDAVEELAEAVGISLTAGVLRRHMKDLFGTRPEPWHALEADQQPQGLPLDAMADDVPLLPATGILDVSALMSRSELMVPTPHRIQLGLLNEDDLPTPLRIPTGSVPMVPLESLMPDVIASSPRPVVPGVAPRGSLPNLPVPMAPPSSPSLAMPIVQPPVSLAERPRRSPLLVIIVAGAVIGIGLAAFFALSNRETPAVVETPSNAPSVTPIIEATPPSTPIKIDEAADVKSEAPKKAKPAVRQPVVKPESKVEPKVEPKTKPEPKAEIKTKPETKLEPKAKADTKSKSETKPEPKPEPKSKAECADPMDCQY